MVTTTVDERYYWIAYRSESRMVLPIVFVVQRRMCLGEASVIPYQYDLVTCTHVLYFLET